MLKDLIFLCRCIYKYNVNIYTYMLNMYNIHMQGVCVCMYTYIYRERFEIILSFKKMLLI